MFGLSSGLDRFSALISGLRMNSLISKIDQRLAIAYKFMQTRTQQELPSIFQVTLYTDYLVNSTLCMSFVVFQYAG